MVLLTSFECRWPSSTVSTDASQPDCMFLLILHNTLTHFTEKVKSSWNEGIGDQVAIETGKENPTSGIIGNSRLENQTIRK